MERRGLTKRAFQFMLAAYQATGNHIMTEQKRLLKRPSESEQKQYEREARLQYEPGSVNESIARWQGYSQAEQEAIIAQGDEIYADFAKAMGAGAAAGDREIDALLERWRDHLRHFYEPSLDMLRGLGQLYNSDPRFIENFQRIHRDLPAFLERVIDHWVDELETAELQRMLAEDEALEQRRGRLSL